MRQSSCNFTQIADACKPLRPIIRFAWWLTFLSAYAKVGAPCSPAAKSTEASRSADTNGETHVFATISAGLCYSQGAGRTAPFLGQMRARTMSLLHEAEKCRQHADDLIGQPEAPFLLKLATAFEDLAHRKDHKPPSERERASC